MCVLQYAAAGLPRLLLLRSAAAGRLIRRRLVGLLLDALQEIKHAKAAGGQAELGGVQPVGEGGREDACVRRLHMTATAPAASAPSGGRKAAAASILRKQTAK